MVVCHANARETIAALNQPMKCKIDLLSFPAVITFDLMRTPHYWRPSVYHLYISTVHTLYDFYAHAHTHTFNDVILRRTHLKFFTVVTSIILSHLTWPRYNFYSVACIKKPHHTHWSSPFYTHQSLEADRNVSLEVTLTSLTTSEWPT